MQTAYFLRRASLDASTSNLAGNKRSLAKPTLLVLAPPVLAALVAFHVWLIHKFHHFSRYVPLAALGDLQLRHVWRAVEQEAR